MAFYNIHVDFRMPLVNQEIARYSLVNRWHVRDIDDRNVDVGL